MTLTERVIWLLIGIAIGAVLGYFARSLQDLKEELDEVKALEEANHPKMDAGAVAWSVLRDVALFLVVIATVWAAFSSQNSSNRVEENQQDIARIAVCNQDILSKTIKALNDRTTYTQLQAESNVDLQKEQAAFLSVLIAVPPSQATARRDATKKYLDALTNFIEVTARSRNAINEKPFPSNVELLKCISRPHKE
jgi:hypothetical protein